MVVDGRIKIHNCEKGVKEIQQDAIVLENGSQVKADIIVLATGYHTNVETVEKILGSGVAQKLDSNFGRMDSENERAGVSTDAHPLPSLLLCLCHTVVSSKLHVYNTSLVLISTLQWWRPTGQPGFWFMTGSFMWCRQYSLALALQIAAVEKGFNESHYGKM